MATCHYVIFSIDRSTDRTDTQWWTSNECSRWIELAFFFKFDSRCSFAAHIRNHIEWLFRNRMARNEQKSVRMLEQAHFDDRIVFGRQLFFTWRHSDIWLPFWRIIRRPPHSVALSIIVTISNNCHRFHHRDASANEFLTLVSTTIECLILLSVCSASVHMKRVNASAPADRTH